MMSLKVLVAVNNEEEGEFQVVVSAFRKIG